ncbi:hemolysin [Taibaiella sp. KBW10]|uniref:hemolysin family protein n=1 Tax=Taibaiella sp. KBW10 TaxID=2153357 RepID=UPI000F5938E7|nr:hemolysin family protein [Taibaiella sp. KBW10]RQO31618.1 hemolysin [Taibaiella sp. KBW10]
MNTDIPPSVFLVTTPIHSWEILLTIFLVLLNGFFVAAEFAIVKVRVSQIEVRTDLSKGLANVAKSIVNNLDSYLAATQLGITLASLGLGWVGEEVMTAMIKNVFDLLNLNISEAAANKAAIPFAFAIITVLHIVFGELAPKSLAIRFPTNTTVYVAWPLKIFYFIFRPIIWTMNGLANGILRLIGIKPMHGSEIHSEEELKMIITESQEGGAIEQTERDLIQNVFDFDDRRVFNIQTLRKNISAIDIDMTVKEALDFAINEGYTRFPVYAESLDNIKGLVYTKDLVKKMLSGEEEANIAATMRKATFISETAKIKNLLKEFQRKHIHMAVVTNEIGELCGIVTLEDILEELVGEIQDEYDNEKPIVEKTGETTYLVNAHQPISDINKYIPFKFEESEHFDTLAGLISEHYEGAEQREGEKFKINEYEVTIIKMYRNSTETVELRVYNEDEDLHSK